MINILVIFTLYLKDSNPMRRNLHIVPSVFVLRNDRKDDKNCAFS